MPNLSEDELKKIKNYFNEHDEILRNIFTKRMGLVAIIFRQR